MSQQDGAPPPDWRQRSERERAMFDALTKHLKAEVAAMNEKLDELATAHATLQEAQKQAITWSHALRWFAALVVVTCGAAVSVAAYAQNTAADAGREALEVAKDAVAAQRQLETFVKSDLREMRSEQKADMRQLTEELRNAARTVERTTSGPARRQRRDGGTNLQDPRGAP